uniref:Uncharacterized protein n=1 Tax=Rhizophora mucronata TaxID=61149 RepID=A0A2P2KG05_RHIMU
MSRRQVSSSTRRFVDAGSFSFPAALHAKSRSSSLLSIALVLLGAVLLIAFAYSGSGPYLAFYRLSHDILFVDMISFQKPFALCKFPVNLVLVLMELNF